MEIPLRRTWAEIDLDNLEHNFRVIRERVPAGTKLLGVIKADGYGHGAVPIARKLEALGADYLAVSNIEEAAEVRENGVTAPILMLGYTPPEQGERIIRLGMTEAVPNLEIARAYDEAAARAGARMKVHIKLDTGMGRLGFQCDEGHFDASLRDILAVLALPHLDVEGVFTHFAAADEETPEAAAFTALQYERFDRMASEAESRGGFRFRLRHCCNAGGIAFYPQFSCDMVRCGILLYGVGELAEALGMKPVLSLKTVVSTVKDFDADAPVSYGRMFYTKRPSRIAVLPIGYADGLQRALSDRLKVMTPYGTAPQVGRICMDMCMIDATELPELKPGDEVEIYGERMLCATAAKAAGTIPYELLCAISKRVPRSYHETK